MSAWVKQKASQVQKHGTEKASWYVVWDKPNGGRRMKSHGRGREGYRLAKLHAEHLNEAMNRFSVAESVAELEQNGAVVSSEYQRQQAEEAIEAREFAIEREATLYSREKAAGLLDVDPSVLRAHQLRGELPGIIVGNEVRYRHVDLVRFLEEQQFIGSAPCEKAGRSNGEGTIYQRRRDGRWVATITLGYTTDPKTGKRKRLSKSAYSRTEEEAKDALDKLKEDADVPRPKGVLRSESAASRRADLDMLLTIGAINERAKNGSC